MRPGLAAAVVGLLALAATGFLVAGKQFEPRFVIRAYFTDGQGLREGARVRLAGIDVGSVRAIGLRHDPKAPVEVVMAMLPEYKSSIPNDAVVSLSTAGVSGETYVRIDTVSASGPPIQANGVLQTTPTAELSTPEILQKLVEAARNNCPSLTDSKKSSQPKSSSSSR